MNNLQRAKNLLEKNKEQNEVHFTSDGFPFFTKTQAESHASRLENRDIETITRAQAAEAKPEGGEPKVKPLNKMNKAELLAEVDKRPGLYQTTEGLSNPKLVEAIEAFDAATPSVTE